MTLTVNLDNRLISFSFFEETDTPVAVFRISAMPERTSDEYVATLGALLADRISARSVDTAIVASVVPTLTSVILAALRTLFPAAAYLTVGAGLRSGLSIRTESPGELGADLVAMSVGAAAICKPPFLVLSCNAVTTLCAVDGDNGIPVFSGCAILPGPTLAARALKNEAAQLSTVALSRPAHAIGTTTADSIRSGVLLGHAAAIEGLINAFEAELDKGHLPIIATGEEIEALLPLLPPTLHYERELSHKGLARIAKQNAKKSKNTKNSSKKL